MNHQQFSEADWEVLLAYIQERNVIPVIGDGLSYIQVDGSEERITFQQWLCGELSTRLDLGDCDSLNMLIQKYTESGKNVKTLYPLIKNLVSASPFSPPLELQKLAQITDFQLLVTTTFDGLLARAIRESHGIPPVELAYSPKKFDDLPEGLESLKSPHLYYLLGQSAAIARYAVCDEDVLEWISSLQSDTHSPERLLSELQNHHLLVIGVNYPDWLGRFFMRTTKRKRLSEDREYFEYLVHPEASSDASLARFLRSNSSNTYLITNCSEPSDFIDELYQRWQDMGSTPIGGNPSQSNLNQPIRFLPPAQEMAKGAIFISYSRTDLNAVKRLKGKFDEYNLPVWFDLESIEGGDSYEQKILNNINNCSYFMPVISKGALDRDEAFFYKEWFWALERKKGIRSSGIFVLPVIIDDTPADHPSILEITSNCDVFRPPEGEPSEEFISRLQTLLQLNNV